jgi:hypothetical protein
MTAGAQARITVRFIPRMTLLPGEVIRIRLTDFTGPPFAVLNTTTIQRVQGVRVTTQAVERGEWSLASETVTLFVRSTIPFLRETDIVIPEFLNGANPRGPAPLRPSRRRLSLQLTPKPPGQKASRCRRVASRATSRPSHPTLSRGRSIPRASPRSSSCQASCATPASPSSPTGPAPSPRCVPPALPARLTFPLRKRIIPLRTKRSIPLRTKSPPRPPHRPHCPDADAGAAAGARAAAVAAGDQRGRDDPRAVPGVYR